MLLIHLPGFNVYLCTILVWGAPQGTLLLGRSLSELQSLACRVVTASGFFSRKIPRPWLEQLGLQIQISSSAERMSLLQRGVGCETLQSVGFVCTSSIDTARIKEYHSVYIHGLRGQTAI